MKRDKNDANYKKDAWKQYSTSELAQWVALLSKRATHRKKRAKAMKDIADAMVYLGMLQERL